MKPAAALTAAMAVGWLSVKSAEALPAAAHSQDQAASIEKHRKPSSPQIGPNGIRALDSTLAIEAEAQAALMRIHERWNGAIVIHAAKKNAIVSVTESPTAYADAVNYISYEPSTKGAHVLVQPYIEKFKGRDYAVIFDEESSKMGFLDIKYAKSVGALGMLAFTDSRPRPVHYNIRREGAELPMVLSTKTVPNSNTYKVTIDASGEPRHVKPSTVVPHA